MRATTEKCPVRHTNVIMNIRNDDVQEEQSSQEIKHVGPLKKKKNTCMYVMFVFLNEIIAGSITLHNKPQDDKNRRPLLNPYFKKVHCYSINTMKEETLFPIILSGHSRHSLFAP